MTTKYDVEVDLGDEGTSHRYMVELVGSNKAVLDVGCSSGYLAKVLRGFGNTITGVEYDPEAAAAAEQYMERVLVADLDHVDLGKEFSGERFDVIVFGDVLEHLRDPLPVLRQARSLLTTGGYVIISVPNVSHGDVRLSLLLGRFPYSNLGLLDTTHLRFFTRETVRELLRDAGFVAGEVRTTKAPLFGTELGVRREEVDAAIVEQIAADPDATTYQFVLTAVPDDATALAEDVGWRLSTALADLDQQRQRVEALTAELDARAGELESSRLEVAELRRALDQADAQRSEVEAQLAGLRELLTGDAERMASLRHALDEAQEAVALEQESTEEALAEARRQRERAEGLRSGAEMLRTVQATKTFRLRRRVLTVLGR